MLFGKPSRSALGVAFQRAIHQVHDAKPLVLDDPIAVPILGARNRAAIEKRSPMIDEAPFPALRSWLVARSRYTEDALAAAVAQGVRQYVLLGAGLDTFALRNPFPELKVYEVDQPATQRWKRKLAKAARLSSRYTHQYVPVDFRSQKLGRELEKVGLDCNAPTVFAWLGVVYFLTRPAFRSTLDVVAAFPPGSGLLMDYSLPREVLSPNEAEMLDFVAHLVAQRGEPYRLFFTQRQMAEELTRFTSVDDLGSAELHELYFANRSENLTKEPNGELGFRGRGSHYRMICAWC